MRGELGFHQPILHLLADDLRCRHGHMIGINDTVIFVFNDTATAEIYTVTRKVFEIVRHASRIAVNTSLGTDLVATFSPTLHWIPSDGRYREQGRWGNLPEGETFTCPLSVAGEIAADEMGDWFADKYGTLPPPLRIKIRAGRMVSVETPDAQLAAEVSEYMSQHPNSNRVGEFACGQNFVLPRIAGNLPQYETFTR